MKRNKVLKITAIIMILTMATIFLIACADNDDNSTPPPQNEITAVDVKEQIEDAILKSFELDPTKPVGFNYEVNLPIDGVRYKVLFNGYLDTKEPSNTRVELDVKRGKSQIFRISADDEFLYFEDAGNKRRITGFKLGDVISGQNFPQGEALEDSLAISIPSMLLGVFFNSDKYEQRITDSKTVNTIYGDMQLIAGMLGSVISGISPHLGNSVTEALKPIEQKLVVTIRNEKIESIDLLFLKDGSAQLKIPFKTKIGNYDPEITTPAKTDNTFVETKVLNFELKGKANLTNENSYVQNLVTSYDYELNVNLDLFEMLRNAISKNSEGKIIFDASKLFNTTDSSIYLNVSHYCTDDCACGKVEKSNGSIFTFAYSPKDFGTNEFYISARPLSILPKGFLTDAIGLAPFVSSLIEPLLSGNFGTNINPEALLQSAPSEEQIALSEGGSLPTNINIIGIINKAIDALGEIRLDSENGLRLGVDKIIDLVYEFTPIIDASAVNIPLAIKMFFNDANYLYIDIDSAIYGNPNLQNKNYYEMFMTVDKNVGEYKFDEKRPGPSVKFEPVRDINGNVVITSSVVTNYEEIQGDDGTIKYKPLPMSKAEYELMLNNKMAIMYDYKTVTGKTGRASTFVNDIYGFDINKVGDAQTVRVVTSLADGMNDGTVGNILTLLVGLLKMDINIPGETFETKLTVDVTPTGEFVQAEDVANKYDANKEYAYDDMLNVVFDLKLTYGEGGKSKVLKSINPISGKELVSGNKIKAIGNFDLVFDYLGYKDTKSVKVKTPNLAKPILDETINIEIGAKYNKFNSPLKFRVEGASRDTSLNIVKDYNTSFVVPEGVKIDKLLNSDGKFSKFEVAFSNAGKYEIVMNVNGGFSKKFIFNVTEEQFVPVLPTFTANIKGTDKFDVTVGKANQIGDLDKVNVMLKVEGKEVSEETTQVKELIFGTDYDILVDGKVLDKNELTLTAFQGIPQKFEIVLKTKDVQNNALRITYLAKDYKNASIGGGEINF